jgi:hypothetical protein
MWEAWKRSRDVRQFEGRLRSARPEASDEFVRSVSNALAPRRRPLMWSRLAFAAAFSTLLLGTFASLGGIGYTTSGASHAYQTVKKLTAAEDVTVERSSAADQYAPAPKPPTQGAAPAEASQGAAAAEAVEQETLPFTGISLLTTALLGIALLAIGLALRRRERRES